MMATTQVSASAAGVHARRFVKYCIVGTSSMAIQLTVLKLVQHLLGSGEAWAVMSGSTAGILLAILNGFYWNRRWTFRVSGRQDVGAQFTKFLAVNMVGIALNTTLMYVFYVRLVLFTGLPHRDLRNQLLTIACVVSWNFYANSRWTFAPRPS